MRLVPIGATHIVQPQPKQEGLQSPLGMLEREPRGIARAAQVADRFIRDRGDVDAGQIARSEQAREFHRIPPVGLHLIAGLLRDERRGDHLAGESLTGQVAIQAVPARPSFVRQTPAWVSSRGVAESVS